jgi:hypothetical protein
MEIRETSTSQLIMEWNDASREHTRMKTLPWYAYDASLVYLYECVMTEIVTELKSRGIKVEN